MISVLTIFSSMAQALPMVKKMVSMLVENAPKIPKWVLTSFRDPAVTVEKETSDVEELRKSLDSLTYLGGGDLREQALKGRGQESWLKIWCTRSIIWPQSHLITIYHNFHLPLHWRPSKRNPNNKIAKSPQDWRPPWRRCRSTGLSWLLPTRAPSSLSWRMISERKAWRRISRSISHSLLVVAKIAKIRCQFINVCLTVGCSTTLTSAARHSSKLSSPRWGNIHNKKTIYHGDGWFRHDHKISAKIFLLIFWLLSVDGYYLRWCIHAQTRPQRSIKILQKGTQKV